MKRRLSQKHQNPEDREGANFGHFSRFLSFRAREGTKRSAKTRKLEAIQPKKAKMLDQIHHLRERGKPQPNTHLLQSSSDAYAKEVERTRIRIRDLEREVDPNTPVLLKMRLAILERLQKKINRIHLSQL